MSQPNREAELAEAKEQYEKEKKESIKGYPPVSFEEWIEELIN